MSIKHSTVTLTLFWNFLDKSKPEYIKPEIVEIDFTTENIAREMGGKSGTGDTEFIP